MSQTRINLLKPIAVIVAVVAIAGVAGIYAFSETDTTIQGEAEADEYRVSSKVPGRILAIKVKEGQQVHAGDTLALLEAPDVTAKYDQAQAAASAANARNRKAEKGVRHEQVQAAHEMWLKAQAGTEIARKSYGRIKRLHEEGVTSAQKLDEATAQLNAAIATEKAAKAQYDMARNGAEREDKETAAALAAQAQGAVREVRSYLNETVLLAAHDGEVTEIFPLAGELVGTGAPIMNIALTNDMWVTFNVREAHLARFRMDSVITATVPGLGGQSTRLKVYFMKDRGSYAAWKATKTTGQYDMKTFEVKARPLQPIKGLRPGMSVIAD